MSVGVLEAELIGASMRPSHTCLIPLQCTCTPQPNKLSFLQLLCYCTFKVEMASMIRTEQTVNLTVEEFLSKCTVFTFLCLTLAFFLIFN